MLTISRRTLIRILKLIAAIPFIFASGAVLAESTVDLQPRDLDGDSSTIEAYYYERQNVTWLANSNLGKTETFGLVRGNFSQNSSEVNPEGDMFNESLPAYLAAVNQSGYLGYSNWRLPIAASDDPGCLRDASASGSGLTGIEGMVAYGSDCSGAEVGELNQFLVSTYGRSSVFPFPELLNHSRVWLSSNGPNGRHHFYFLTTDRGDIGDLRSCPTTDGIRDCLPAAVWLVHDGDIGVSPYANSPAACSDALSEAPPTNSDYNFEFSFGDMQSCLPTTALATITAYAFDNRIQDDFPITTVATWGPTPVGGYTTLRPGMSHTDLLNAVQGDIGLADIQYYFDFKVDLDGDGEICNGDLTQTRSSSPLGGYPGTQLSVIDAIQLEPIVNTPCNKTPLQARSLDNDALTIEAYYDASQNITWLADANLGASQSFGLNRGNPESGDFSYQITDDGQVESQTIEEYLTAMNANGWLGQNGWRLPITQGGDNDCSDYVSSVFFISNSTGIGCRSEMGNLFLAKEQGAWSDGDFFNTRSEYWSVTISTQSSNSARYNFDFSSGTQSVSTATESYGPLFHLWLVHDGDIGDAIDTIETDPPASESQGGGTFWLPMIVLLLFRRVHGSGVWSSSLF